MTIRPVGVSRCHRCECPEAPLALDHGFGRGDANRFEYGSEPVDPVVPERRVAGVVSADASEPLRIPVELA